MKILVRTNSKKLQKKQPLVKNIKCQQNQQQCALFMNFDDEINDELFR